MSNFKLVKGKLPKKNEVADWSELKIISFLKFLELFSHDGKYSITDARRKEVEERSNDDYFDEFLTRIDRYVDGTYPNRRQFQMRLIVMARSVLSWLKQNPYAVTDDIKKLMESNPICHWAMSAFSEIDTNLGVPTVILDQSESTDPNRRNANQTVSNVKSPQVLYEQALLSAVGILHELVSSFKKGELSKLDAEKKLKLITNLLPVIQKNIDRKNPNTIVFQKIVTAKASRDELEKSLLEYSESQN